MWSEFDDYLNEFFFRESWSFLYYLWMENLINLSRPLHNFGTAKRIILVPVGVKLYYSKPNAFIILTLKWLRSYLGTCSGFILQPSFSVLFLKQCSSAVYLSVENSIGQVFICFSMLSLETIVHIIVMMICNWITAVWRFVNSLSLVEKRKRFVISLPTKGYSLNPFKW